MCKNILLFRNNTLTLHPLLGENPVSMTGKVPEWSIGAVSKTVVRFAYRGFESLPFRRKRVICLAYRQITLFL